MPDDNVRLNLKEAAARLGVSQRSLREMCKDGRITYTRIDRLHWSFRLSDIEAFLERHTFEARTVYDKKPAKKPGK
jgi:excisionase family DNA binding protein